MPRTWCRRGGLSRGEIIGVIFGVVAAATIAVLAALLLVRRRNGGHRFLSTQRASTASSQPCTWARSFVFAFCLLPMSHFVCPSHPLGASQHPHSFYA